jgi:hypothetical protein
MPARFLNISGNGQARFSNVSNSGRAVFGEVTSTGTTTTTTTNNLLNITVHLDTTQTCPGGVVIRKVEGGTLGEGKVLYLADGITPVTGFNYVVDGAGGPIYNINSGTGLIGAATGTNC